MKRTLLKTLAYAILLFEIGLLAVCALIFLVLSVFTKTDEFAKFIDKKFMTYSLALYIHNKIEYPPGEI